MPVEIVEILRRSEQGLSEPFICRADNEEIYFVKGRASREDQIFEWIAGNLGKELGMPLADFELVEVPDELLDPLSFENRRDLGAGVAFGSKERRINELRYAGIDEIPVNLQQDVFMFDLWIMNQDRTLFEDAGNPNLFWDPVTKNLVVIDHNNAFDSEATPEILLKNHVFRINGKQVQSDFFLREDYTNRFSCALAKWDKIIAALPGNWFFADDDMTAPLDINLDALLETLSRYKNDEFWTWS